MILIRRKGDGFWRGCAANRLSLKNIYNTIRVLCYNYQVLIQTAANRRRR
jgi:hypothetical protein